MIDVVVAGAGFAGCVLAERAAATGLRVIVCDVRPHVGGNAYDRLDAHGIRVHEYGPHILHTNSEAVWKYLSGFTEWRPYQHRVLASVDGQLLPIPINLDTVNRLYGTSYSPAELIQYFARVAEPVAAIRTAEDVVVSRVGRALYEKFIRGYSRKQWGLDPSELDASVTARLPVRTDRDDRYFTDTFQAMPADGYTALFERMLDHPNIELRLGTDYRAIKCSYRRLIYTGPIDAYFDFGYGKLPYRSLEFKHETLPVAEFQPVAQVNYPNEHDYTRITEFKHLTGQRHEKTSIVYEYPRAQGDPYYPIPCAASAALYQRYRALAGTTATLFVGRLASYRYYNMDQVVAQALKVAEGFDATQPMSHAAMAV